ncbi:MAG: hypothetical protein IKG30_10260 [Clostridiales bacterium]|nr:hypothetical protein [Clostridiales bacterium]
MRRLYDSKLVSGRSLIKILSVVMCVVMISGLAGLSGCKFINNITNGLNVAQKPISEAELARLITNAVISDSNVADCYAGIPSSQLDDLSYSMFSQYCSILRKCSQKHGTADSFRILSETEKLEYFQEIDSSGEDFRTIEYYGDMDVVELCYSKDKDKNAPPVRFVISKRSNCTVAGKYIVDSMLAYSYINHYFEMIDDQNADGLEAIIKSAYNSDIYLNSVIHAKADYIVNYYRLKVKTSSPDYELNLFSPTHISYVIPEVFSTDGSKIVSKTVELKLKNDGKYLLDDDIPATIKELRFSREGGSGRLRMGSTYTFDEIRKILGSPMFQTTTSDLVILAYDGMTLRLDADIEENGQWTSGRLVSILLRENNEFTFGEDLYIGMNISELLLVYPMFDECGYTGSFKNGDGEFVLTFEFDEYGNVSNIQLGEAVG